jgi:hypothetical protein
LSPDSFRRVLLSAIDEGLSSLGNSPREAIFYHLETSFQIKKKDIPLNLSEFREALERIFGPGTPYLEKIISKRLYEKVGLDFEDTEKPNLVASVDEVKKQLLHVGGEKR